MASEERETNSISDGKPTHNNLLLEKDLAFTFDFERSFNVTKMIRHSEVYYFYSVYYCLAYLVIIYLGQSIMKNRKPLEMRWLLFVWNLVKSMTSMIGTSRHVHELVQTLWYHGFEHSLCELDFSQNNAIFVCWIYVFCITKATELFDTMFLVLRKREVRFIHWFHHSSALVFTWYATHANLALGRWLTTMNYTIHSVMYLYYAFRTLKFRIGRPIAMFITTMQISQMFVALFISVRAFGIWVSGKKCMLTTTSIVATISLYGFYCVLFLHFFINNYLRHRKSKSV